MATQGTTQPLTVDDRELLRTATLANVNWSGERRFTHRDVDERPDLRHYTLFGPDRGDLGFVAEVQGLVAGMTWALFLDSDDPGYGFVADGVPEPSLSVWSGYRGQGVGGELLRLALAEACLRGSSR